MKRLFLLPLLLLGLCSCKNQIEVSFKEAEVVHVYAVHDLTDELREVELEYPVENEVELFHIYTIYQNHLPLGYSSPANPNIELISSSIHDNCVAYKVNNFILLSDIVTFHKALLLTGKQFGFKEIHIFLNEKQLI